MRDNVIRYNTYFWREDGKGYTNLVSLAGLYTAEHAHRIQNGGRGDTALPLKQFEEELQERQFEVEKELGMIREKLDLIKSLKNDKGRTD